MATKIKHYGKVDDEGKLTLASKLRFQQHLKDRFKGKEVELTIKVHGQRTTQANRYYWGVIVVEIQEAFRQRGTFMENEAVHEFLKFHFNKQYIIDSNTGEAISEYGGSTTEMNQDEMIFYCDTIRQWALEKLDIDIPLPNTQAKMFEDDSK